MIKISEKILSMTKSINANDDIEIVENTFFKLYCYNIYQDNIFNSGYAQHYFNILKENGFNVSSVGETSKLEKETQKQINEVYEMIKQDEFDEFVEERFIEIETEEDIKKDEELGHVHKVMSVRCDLLNIPTKEYAIKYQKYIVDEYALTDYFNFLGLFRKEEYIIKKLKEKENESFKVKMVTNIFSKLSLLSQFEKHYKIERFNLDFSNIDDTIEISNQFQTLQKTIFPTIKFLNITKKGLLKFYIGMLKNICGYIQIVKAKKVKVDKVCAYKHSLDTDNLKDLLTLVKFNNPGFSNLDHELIEKHTNLKPEAINKIHDEDKFINYYLFQKNNFKLNY